MAAATPSQKMETILGDGPWQAYALSMKIAIKSFAF